MNARADRRAAFLRAHGWAGADVAAIAGDASFRAFHRLTLGPRRAVLMDAPPPMEDVRPFADIADRLVAAGFSAPRIEALDPENGFLVMEDLGDARMDGLLDAGAPAEPIYALATDTLAAIQNARIDPAGLPGWGAEAQADSACLLVEWWLAHRRGLTFDAGARAAYRDAWLAVLGRDAGLPPTLVLRDYFPANLMRLSDRTGIRACGLLDFQDAGVGSPAYDLVSLLRDARRDVPAGLEAAMKARFLAQRPELDAEAFETAYAVQGAQRAARILGTFTRLDKRDGKPGYLVHLPRVARDLARALAHPALAPVAAWFETHAPLAKKGAA